MGIVKAQNNLIIMDEDGRKFFLFIDDKQINDSAQSEVKATKIYDDTCIIRAVYQNKNIATFIGKAYLEENGRSANMRDFTYSISTEKHGTRLEFISMNYSLSDTTLKSQIPEKRINSIFIERANQKEENDKLNEIYPKPGPCIKAVSDSLLESKMKILRDNHTELNRIKDAKWFVSHNCINTAQLKKLIKAFDYRLSQVKIAEFAYDYIEDHRNFLEIVDEMEFVTEKEEIKTFFNKRIEK